MARASARRLSRLVSGRCAGGTGRSLSGGPTPSSSGGGGGGPVKPAKGAADPAAPSVNKNPAAERRNRPILGRVDVSVGRAVLSDGRQDGPMKPWQKLYWAAFGAAVLFLAGNRARVYYQSVKSKEELEADPRENRRAMQAALEGSRSRTATIRSGMEPHEIEALLRQNAPTGTLTRGWPGRINAYLAKQQEEQVGKHLSMPRNIPRPR